MAPQTDFPPQTSMIHRCRLLGSGPSNDNIPMRQLDAFPASLHALVEALARVQEERDHSESISAEAVQ